ncbi:MAG: methionine--tRNA ligase [Elusimicrobia bacterium]|nr:methionine--tRNA ligase [Elusimicrobiota bacterium]
MSKPFYVTTPIYYINAKPHIGHAYTTLAADILNRFHKGRGRATYFLTGTDEHGLKIEEAAKKNKMPTPQYADEVAQMFRDMWTHLDVRYDDFIRTTEPRHEERVKAAVQRLFDSKDIYKGTYKGYYCVSCETFFTDTELSESSKKAPGAEGKPDKGPRCPQCSKPLQFVEEESYFFALSKYQDRLLKHFKDNPDFLRPAHRANEILRFVESGLRDLSVSRKKSQVAWGVPFPFDADHTVYVWFDALLNYVSAAGWQPDGSNFSALDGTLPDRRPPFGELWPADVHFVGKEIYRFHAVIWPAMLMGLGLELPKTVFAHGWWTFEGEKMSKSKGNIVAPDEITREYGVDALRYFLFREMPFGNDGAFSHAAFHKRYNADLANDLGNLVSRVTNLVDTRLGGVLPTRPPLDRPFISKEVAAETPAIAKSMEELAFCDALNRIWAVISRLNTTVNVEAPWKLADSDPEKFKFLMFDLIWSLRIIAGWLEPFMPRKMAEMQSMLGVRRMSAHFSAEEVLTGSSDKIQKGPALFPRK